MLQLHVSPKSDLIYHLNLETKGELFLGVRSYLHSDLWCKYQVVSIL